MRILHIIPSLAKGGAERLCLDICNYLIQNDHEVKLITFRKDNDYKKESSHLDLEIISCNSSLSFLRGIKQYPYELEEVIYNFQPDVIHTHLFETEIVSRSIKYTRAKWITHCHSNMKQFNNFKWNNILDKKHLTNLYEKKYLIKKYIKNEFITVSENSWNFYHETIPKRLKNIQLLPNAINCKRFFKKAQNNLVQSNTKEILKLISIGSLNNNKNHQFLIKTVDVLLKRNINLQLDILGDGPNYHQLTNEIEQKRLTNNVFLHGKVDTVEQYLWKSDIYIHAARSESFGLVLIEAMASGLPVVCLDAGGNRDLIINGFNGFILNEDKIQFADAILKTYETYNKFSKNALHSAKEYDMKEYIQQLIKIYEA